MSRPKSSLLGDIQRNHELLLTLLDKPISFNKMYKHLTGSVSTALMLSYLVAQSESLEQTCGGWFAVNASTTADAADETGLSEAEQTNALTQLLEQGYVTGRSSKSSKDYRVDMQAITLAMQRFAEQQATKTSAGNASRAA